jgi:NAD-dependent SIR2 family protein deacetylase
VELVDAGVGFQLADCKACGSDMLKPDVVFFGDSVPKDRVER